jgi:hypothetical protein
VTTNVEAYDFQHQGRRITIVDTPGFDDSKVSDREILIHLLEWLQSEMNQGRKLNGILYLHRIDAPRMQGSSLKNFGMFKQLCGEDFYKNIFLGTTCWDKLEDIATGERRELELKEKGGFWYGLIQRGSEIVRIPWDAEEARNLVLRIASQDPSLLESQREVAKLGGQLEKLSIVRDAEADLERIRIQHLKEQKEQQERLAQAAAIREKRMKEEREREKNRQREQLRQQEAERQRLLRVEKEKREKRDREMKQYQERMRREALEEERRRQEERLANQIRLDDSAFSFGLKTFIQGQQYADVKATLFLHWRNDVCNNCYRVLRDEDYVGKKTRRVKTKTLMIC